MNMKLKETLPTLYKKNQNGKIEEWNVRIVGFDTREVNYRQKKFHVVQVYGERDGKKQTKTFTVTEGKNIGKRNETNPYVQAMTEAYAKWEKKLKQGYTKTLKEAQAGKTDAIIKGGISPMLAHSYDDHADKMMYPAYVQPKLDGQRCVAIFDGSKVTLWTRSRKQILSCPHIIEQLTMMLRGFKKKAEPIILDGELYCHKLKDNFEKIMSAVRKNKPTKEAEEIEFHIYDIVDYVSPFKHRHLCLKSFPDFYSSINFVDTYIVKNETELKYHHKTYVKEGYEGLMIRSIGGMYENKRSKSLLKFKTFLDAEYNIIRFEEGKDNTVVAVLTNGQTQFRATMTGDKKVNKKYLTGKWSGKLLTVKFFSYTNANKVPRFPVGMRVRDEL